MWCELGFWLSALIILALLVATAVTAYAVGRWGTLQQRPPGRREDSEEVLGATGGVVTSSGEAWLRQLAGKQEPVPWMDHLRRVVRHEPQAGDVLRIEVHRVGREEDHDDA